MEYSMELPGTAYLYTLATVAITFVGFSTLFILIRQALGKTMSAFDILLTKNFLQLGFMVAFGSLLAPLLSLLQVGDIAVWRIASAIAAMPAFVFTLTYPRRRAAAVRTPVPKEVWFDVSAVFVAGVILLANAVGWPWIPGVGLYAAGLTIILSISFLAFLHALDFLLEQPKT
jgi:hypothetical protein